MIASGSVGMQWLSTAASGQGGSDPSDWSAGSASRGAGGRARRLPQADRPPPSGTPSPKRIGAPDQPEAAFGSAAGPENRRAGPAARTGRRRPPGSHGPVAHPPTIRRRQSPGGRPWRGAAAPRLRLP